MASDDMMKLSPEDHMEVLSLLMQMDKLSDYTDSRTDSSSHREVLLPESAYIGLSLYGNSSGQHPGTFHSFSSSTCNNVPFSEPALASLNQGWPGAYATQHPQYGCKGGHRGGGGVVATMAEMREMIFRIAAMQPIHIDPEAVKPPKRKNVRISKDPQSVAARHRRERISERIRILQRLVPGGTKMDTASMLDEAIHYVKFLKRQVQTLEQASVQNNSSMPTVAGSCLGFPVSHTYDNNNNESNPHHILQFGSLSN